MLQAETAVGPSRGVGWGAVVENTPGHKEQVKNWGPWRHTVVLTTAAECGHPGLNLGTAWQQVK